MQTLVNGLLDAVDARQRPIFDVMTDLAAPLPAMVIAQLLGIPARDWQQFKRWSDGLIGFHITQAKLDGFAALGRYLADCIAERRRDPRDDLISGLIAARDQDDALTEEELIGQCVILLVGGHETSTFALGTAVYRLLADRPLWERVAEVSIDGAVEELLRYDSPFQALSRRTKVAVSINGYEIDPGATIWLWIAAANRDPWHFAAPERLDLERADNRHLSFGMGPHYCLGAALARLELQVAIATLRERYPALALLAESVVWKEDGAIRGPQSLPVTLN
jgi:cytochrome P450